MTNPQTAYYQKFSIVKLRHQMKQRGLDISNINHSDEDKNRAVQSLLNDDSRIVAAEVQAMAERLRAIEEAKQTETARQTAENAARKVLADAVAHQAEERVKREAEQANLQAQKQTESARKSHHLQTLKSQLNFDDGLLLLLPPKALPTYRAMKARVLKAKSPEVAEIEEIDRFLNDFVYWWTSRVDN
ncbi:uncharacterized protein MYCFIDRAFT_176260 [Pseudocercospora fijiensis CIRAD86]|uniref:Uncharacterized protein n=1 Tax=Pseudocercospora fijiensis (strain CIRAD86) TaxID=383855 RepID=M3AUS1_PSEFD|nr:uncharacterized protein MYCFIDRAFT_176260 [Pseudocercospora fijiensis CIRAD86]EME80903.1 hypothetical protein MYCFIDRAFT_176260 [Pseudocercospora fijiensis CIRAD86]